MATNQGLTKLKLRVVSQRSKARDCIAPEREIGQRGWQGPWPVLSAGIDSRIIVTLQAQYPTMLAIVIRAVDSRHAGAAPANCRPRLGNGSHNLIAAVDWEASCVARVVRYLVSNSSSDRTPPSCMYIA